MEEIESASCIFGYSHPHKRALLGVVLKSKSGRVSDNMAVILTEKMVLSHDPAKYGNYPLITLVFSNTNRVWPLW